MFVVLFKYIVGHRHCTQGFMCDDSVQNIQNRYNLVTNEWFITFNTLQLCVCVCEILQNPDNNIRVGIESDFCVE